jgi:hypothetical protein
MSNVDTTKFSAYLDAFHRAYVETVVEHVPAQMRGFLERFSRLPCRVIGYVSTNFGVAFEYVPRPEETTVGHSSSRIEDFFLGRSEQRPKPPHNDPV